MAAENAPSGHSAEGLFYFFVFVVGVLLGLWGIRYGVVGVLFFQLILARALSSFSSRSSVKAILTAAFLLLLLITNGWQIFHFITIGRGEYPEAFRYMAAQTNGDYVTVTSRKMAVLLQLQFYEQDLPKQVVFLDSAKYPWKPMIDFRVEESDRYNRAPEAGETAQWFIIVDKRHVYVPDDVLSFEGASYHFERLFPYYAVSGHDWFLYRRDDVAE